MTQSETSGGMGVTGLTNASTRLMKRCAARVVSARLRSMGSVLLLLCVLWDPVPAQSQETSQTSIEEIESKAEQRKKEALKFQEEIAKIEHDLEPIQLQMQALTHDIRKQEERVEFFRSGLASRYTALDERRAKIRSNIQKWGLSIAWLADVIEKPTQALLLRANDPSTAVRTAIVLRHVAPLVRARAEVLRSAIEDSVQALQVVEKQEAMLQKEVDELAKNREQLGEHIEARRVSLQQLAARSVAAQNEASRLASKAHTLRELIEAQEKEKSRLNLAVRSENERASDKKVAPQGGSTDDGASTETEPVSLESQRGKRPTRGSFVLPVRSWRVARSFGETAEDGSPSRGLVLSVRPGEEILAPFDGRVRFAGPFRAFGTILIIEHRDGNHSVLAGFGQLDAVVGQWLLAGEPVGFAVTEGSAIGTFGANLYLEIRERGQPTDPAEWFDSSAFTSQQG